MTVQDSPTIASSIGTVGAIELARPRAGAAKPRPIRRLPVQKDWPTWALLATQIGILLGAIAFWEIGARAGWIHSFFWPQPSAIAHTLVILFTAGVAWTDIG